MKTKKNSKKVINKKTSKTPPVKAKKPIKYSPPKGGGRSWVELE